MNYRIVDAESDGVRLRRTGESILISVIGMLIGCLMGLIGSAMAFTGLGMSHMVGIAFMIATPVFIVFPFVLMRKERNSFPKEIIFDNRQHVVVLLNKNPQYEPAFLPYTDIIEFDIVKETNTSSSGSVTTNSYSYIVRCKMKSGMYWSIASFANNQQAAEAMLHVLQVRVRLVDEGVHIPLGALPQQFSMESAHSQTVLSWRKQREWVSVVLVVFFFAIFFSLVYIMNSATDSFGVILYIIGGVGVVVFVGVLRDLLKNYTSISKVTITNEQLIIGDNKHIPLGEIACVSTELSGTVTSKLFVLTAEQIQQQRDLYTSGTTAKEVWRSIKESFAIPTIDIGMLPLTQRITLQHYVNREIAKRKGEEEQYTTYLGSATQWQSDLQNFERRGFNNIQLGIVVLVFSCTPILSIVAMLTLYQTSWFLYLAKGYILVETLRLLVAGYVGYILVTRYKHIIRGYGMMILPLLVVGLFLFGDTTASQFVSFALMIVMLLSGITLILIPEDE
ncbi:MAG: hypothetical protein U0Y96_04105 [Candidatus Kapaibacterium sp.]